MSLAPAAPKTATRLSSLFTANRVSIIALAERPVLILMDMSLPVIDGWEATRRIKADAATRGIPVIAPTAHAMAGCDS